MIENKKILVTGAGGFIGGHLIKELLKHNNDIGFNWMIIVKTILWILKTKNLAWN